MAYFTIRIELSMHSPELYAQLDLLMIQEGFRKTVTLGKHAYTLPTGEYNFIGNLFITDVRELAKRTAEKSGGEFSLLVTESKGIRQWYNLPVASR